MRIKGIPSPTIVFNSSDGWWPRTPSNTTCRSRTTATVHTISSSPSQTFGASSTTKPTTVFDFLCKAKRRNTRPIKFSLPPYRLTTLLPSPLPLPLLFSLSYDITELGRHHVVIIYCYLFPGLIFPSSYPFPCEARGHAPPLLSLSRHAPSSNPVPNGPKGDTRRCNHMHVSYPQARGDHQ